MSKKRRARRHAAREERTRRKATPVEVPDVVAPPEGEDLEPLTDDASLGDRPRVLGIIRAAFWLNAMIWFAFGSMVLTQMATAGTPPTQALLVALAMALNAGAMLTFGRGLGEGREDLFWPGVIFVGANMIAVIAWAMTGFGIASLVVDTVLLMLLYGSRNQLVSGGYGK